MTSRAWYGTAFGAALQAVGAVALAAVPEGRLQGAAAAALLVALLAGYLLVVVATPLDARSLRGAVPWEPSAGRWALVALVPVVGAVAGFAYCVRRAAAVRGTVPGDRWYRLVAGTVVVWTAALAIEIAVDYVSLGPVDRYLFPALLLVGMFVGPVATYLDAAHVRGHTDWHPRAWAWSVGAGVPYLGALVGAGFLVRRRRAFAAADDPGTVSLPDGTATDAGPSAPWFRRAAAVFVVHFLLVVVFAVAAGPGVDDTTIQLGGVLLWLPFGPVFAGCVYKDAAWRRANDRDVGDNWFLYLSSVLVQAVAFWYLLRRLQHAQESAAGPEA